MAPLVMIYGIAAAQSAGAPKDGDGAPDFSIRTDRGRRISPGAFGGRILVMNFWETSCVPCVKELPSLVKFARAFQKQRVIVVAVSADEDAGKYRRFLRTHHVSIETYRDPDRRISKSFGTIMFPETYIIQNGSVIRKITGAMDWMNEDIRSFIHARLIGNTRRPPDN